ncbi:hypothetical protein HDU92_005909 [Lobulomyces angularis]|nr:hypothetical protein HDU92_005909 [Lobulomyces angularis]
MDLGEKNGKELFILHVAKRLTYTLKEVSQAIKVCLKETITFMNISQVDEDDEQIKLWKSLVEELSKAATEPQLNVNKAHIAQVIVDIWNSYSFNKDVSKLLCVNFDVGPRNIKYFWDKECIKEKLN